MRRAVGLAISASLFAGVALAEPAVPQAAAPTTTASPGTAGKTVEGLTVTGKVFPKTECSPRDAACIRLVVAELKRLYPEQLKRFCFQRQLQAMRETTLFGDADPVGS